MIPLPGLALVALYKRAIVSDSLVKICSFHHVLTVFHCFSPFYAQERIAPVALFKERREQFTLVALYKRATVSDSLPSLFSKEQREQFALFSKKK